MAPRWLAPSHSLFSRDQSNANASFAAVKSQWQNPTDILSVLMIIGGDIVQHALAQLAGGSPFFFTPVAFSFGWVAYSFSAILSAVGSGSLMPPPDCSAICVNVKSGYTRDINSWVLSRLVRDYKPSEKHDDGLTITFFRTSSHRPTGTREHDWVYYIGVFTIILQLGIACIPGAVTGNWVILIITFGGNILAQLGAALPQWRNEMWQARPLAKGKREVVCLTRGNGSTNVIVVDSDGCGIKLEDLATGREVHSPVTIVATFVFALLWIVHLLTVESLEDSAWYSLAIGALGMLQNVISAGARRTPAALGFHLVQTNIVYRPKVFQALQAAEEIENQVGLVLVDVFFPGPAGLRPHEEVWRQEKLAKYKAAMQKADEKAAEKEKEDYTPPGRKSVSPSATLGGVSESPSAILLSKEID